MIKYYLRTLKDVELKEVAEFRSGVWVSVVEPSPQELETLAEKFKLDVDVVSDALDFYEVPRLEKEDGVTYFFTRYPVKEPVQGNTTAPILVVVAENFVMTVSLYEVPQFKQVFSSNSTVYTTQKAKFFIRIMSIFTTSFDKELRRYQKSVHRDQIRLRKISPRDIERLVSYETSLNSIVDTLMPTNLSLQQITNGGSTIKFFQDDLEDMRDLAIDNSQVVNSARSVLKTIQNIRSAAEAIMTSRLNNSLSILTVLTILLTIPLVITSMYGMNVALPIQDEPNAFLVILAVNALILIGLTVLFKKKDWM